MPRQLARGPDDTLTPQLANAPSPSLDWPSPTLAVRVVLLVIVRVVLLVIVLYRLLFSLLFSEKSSVFGSMLLSCPGRGPHSTPPAHCPGQPLRDHRRGVWHGDSHPGATIQMTQRLTSLATGTTFSQVVRIRISVGIFSQGPPASPPATHRGACPRPFAGDLFCCLLALAPVQVSRPSACSMSYSSWLIVSCSSFLSLSWTRASLGHTGTCPGNF